MKRISVDTHFNFLGPKMPAISNSEAELYSLNPGDEVLASQDDDEWVGTAQFDPGLPKEYQWYIVLHT